MAKSRLNPKTVFDSRQYGFSQGVVSQGGKTVYLSGQVAWDAAESIVGQGDLKAQAAQALRNVEALVSAAGGRLEDIVSMRIYVVDEKMDENEVIGETLRTYFQPDHMPATSWIGVTRLANKDFLIEIEAIAVIKEDQ